MLIVLLCLITTIVAFLILTILLDDAAPEDVSEVVPPVVQAVEPDTLAKTSPQTSTARRQAAPRVTQKPRETVSERVNRMTSLSRPPRAEKLSPGMTLELNAADTTALKKVPGIGSAFAGRIVKFRNLLGGYYSVSQLMEVYGIDEEKYAALSPWFTVDASKVQRLSVNLLPADSLRKHPYISYRQARVIERLRKQNKGLAGWENLQLLEDFTEQDKLRLLPYLSFE